MGGTQRAAAQYSNAPGENHVSLHGVVDLFVAGELHEVALRCAASGHPTQVDCRELERIDGSALQLLLALERDHRERAAAFTLRAVPEVVSRYLHLAGAWPLLAVVREEEALSPPVNTDPEARRSNAPALNIAKEDEPRE